MSASEQTPVAVNAEEQNAAAAATYGTRSRNRGAGVARPNYAEDREIEADYEVVPTYAKNDGNEGLSGHHHNLAKQNDQTQQNVAADPSKAIHKISEGGGTYKSKANMSQPPLGRDTIPGTSSFTTNTATSGGNSQPLKKRKTGHTSTPVSHTPPQNDGTPTQSATQPKCSSLPIGPNGHNESSIQYFENTGARLQDGKLIADDGTVYRVNDNVYLVCEPPGEPYYLGRIMEFLHVQNDPSKPVDTLRMNWFYRPKDIGRRTNDTRQVFASMHSDISPINALRGPCEIRLKSQIENFEEYRRTPNCFWYDQLFDRYIQRYYEVIPTDQVVNVPAKVKRVLDERWKYILVEQGRGKELTSASKSCRRCQNYCANNNSVDCAVCGNTYHMNCVRPPLAKKPSRGFAWACGPCNRAQERKMAARDTPTLGDAGVEVDDEEHVEEEEDLVCPERDNETGVSTPAESVIDDGSIHPGTKEQIYQASLWPYRYLGIHCKVEDALDYDDRIYPRATSRLGTKHQADIPAWPGRPFEYVKPVEIKKKYNKSGSHKKDGKLTKETIALIEADRLAKEQRPKWVVDEPPGYVHRGEDYEPGDPNATSELLFKPLPESDDPGSQDGPDLIDKYMERASDIAKKFHVPAYSANFRDQAINRLFRCNWDVEKALNELSRMSKSALKEPELSPDELKRFEQGVAKYGSELLSVKRHVKTVSPAHIVRFYYVWKKTERGKQIWNAYPGRKGKKEKRVETAPPVKLQDDIADDRDDSAFDNDKAMAKKKTFQCKFCTTTSSRRWRRAPASVPGALPTSSGKNKDKNAPQPVIALCLSCAIIWRKYAVQWEEPEDAKKKDGGGRSKRRGDDPQREFYLNEVNLTAQNTAAFNTPRGGTPMSQFALDGVVDAVAKKKKVANEAEQSSSGLAMAAAPPHKKKAAEKSRAPTPPPELPKLRTLPCAICSQMEPRAQHLTCRECRLPVHKGCYGVPSTPQNSAPNFKWVCDMCSNDRNPQVSLNYQCMLCPVTVTPQDFVDPPKVSHKKRTDKERERDRLEKEMAVKAVELYKKRQEELGRPVFPREPLKRTANNNWVHVTCAVWTPEVKFGNAKLLEPSEGIPLIPEARYSEVCTVCKTMQGACVHCHTCKTPVHVECAHKSDYVLGFDINPVKGSRKDHALLAEVNGDVGTMTAALWCKAHAPTKTIVHKMHEIDAASGHNALEIYTTNYKQADLTLTGTVRKATLVHQSKMASSISGTTPIALRRASTTTLAANGSKNGFADGANGSKSSDEENVKPTVCVTCGTTTSPKWWSYPPGIEKRENGDGNAVNGTVNGTSPKQQVALAAAALGEHASGSSAQSEEMQCHKCHFNKVVKRAPSPPRPAPPRGDQISTQPISHPPVAQPPAAHYGPPQPTPQYPWSAPAYQQPNGHPDWQHRVSSAGTGAPLAPYSARPSIFQHSQSPHTVNSLSPMSQQRQQPGPSILSPQSHTGAPVPVPVHPVNGYATTSPHQLYTYGPASQPPPPPRAQYDPYNGLVATRPAAPQHLINGGPPPQAMGQPPPFTHGTAPYLANYPPPVPRSAPGPEMTPLQHSQQQHSQQQQPGPQTPHMSQGAHASPALSMNGDLSMGGRPGEQRPSSGASAKPSLQNLLS